MFYSKRAHQAVIDAYERTVAVLREQLSAMQKQLDASLTREAAAREDAVRVASAAAFPRYPEPAPPIRHSAVQQRRATENADAFAEVPFSDPSGTFRSIDEAALLTEDETAALRAALGGETDAEHQ